MNSVRRIENILLVVLILALLALGCLFILGFAREKNKGELLVESNIDCVVFVNNERVGTTPLRYIRKSGKVNVKLTPSSSDAETPFEVELKVEPKTTSIVRRFYLGDNKSWGEVIYFEKLKDKDVELSVLSEPDSAQVSLDGISKGFTPYKTSGVSEGIHQLRILSVEAKERTLMLTLLPGYRLVVSVDLERIPAPSPSPPPTPVPMVRILNTPTGFLRVRRDPDKSSEEIRKVSPGEEYPRLEEVEGWIKIVFADGQEGWISKEYVEIIQ